MPKVKASSKSPEFSKKVLNKLKTSENEEQNCKKTESDEFAPRRAFDNELRK